MANSHKATWNKTDYSKIGTKGRTTINIKKEIRDLLKKKKKYARETYDDIIARELNLKGILKE
tara:strand:- start:259 stop:447 length:189 start_codon:yes stop_codon:yes gene_type:complete